MIIVRFSLPRRLLLIIPNILIVATQTKISKDVKYGRTADDEDKTYDCIVNKMIKILPLEKYFSWFYFSLHTKVYTIIHRIFKNITIYF